MKGLAALAEAVVAPNGCGLEVAAELGAKGFDGLACPEKGFDTGAGVFAGIVDCAVANGLVVLLLVAAFVKGFTA